MSNTASILQMTRYAGPSTTDMDMRRGVSENEFEVYYQPKFDLKTMEVVGSEALVRWIHPELGMIGPGSFIDKAEKNGMIGEIGAIVLRTACADTSRLRSNGIDVNIAVNISAPQVLESCFMSTLSQALSESSLNPTALELEVTETSFALDHHLILPLLREIRRSGVGVAIDDFGTGYSSLAYLKQIPATTIKIDKSFIDGLPHDGSDKWIIRCILDLAGRFEIDVVAEGIENHEQAATLMGMGCRYGQGYLMSAAMPIEDYTEWLGSYRNAMTI